MDELPSAPSCHKLRGTPRKGGGGAGVCVSVVGVGSHISLGTNHVFHRLTLLTCPCPTVSPVASIPPP